MIERTRGDILRADAEALVNSVNCVGVMGRGIALQFREAFPENYRYYRTACEREEVRPGAMLVYDLGRLTTPRYIINFPTKRHWRGKSRIEDIDAGLKALVEEVRGRGIRSIAVPPLGAGLGGLDWADVRPRIERAFRDLPEVRVLLYEPGSEPTTQEKRQSSLVPRMTVGRAALLGLMRRYLLAAMDPSVSLLEIHKLMYFMQEAGQPLKLQYAKGPYGPYAENLRHVLRLIDGHFIKGFREPEDSPRKQIELVPEAAEEAEAFLVEDAETRGRFERVVALIEGFETPFGMELLSTVHWVAMRENASTADEAIQRAYAWNARKRMFAEEHLGIAWNALERQGWLQSGQPTHARPD